MFVELGKLIEVILIVVMLASKALVAGLFDRIEPDRSTSTRYPA